MATYDTTILNLCKAYLRSPSNPYQDTTTGAWVLPFDPPLTTAEQATFADLQTMAKLGVAMTLAEWQAIKADAAALKTFYGLASPTTAQTVAATKAIIHVLSVIVRS